MLNRFKRASSDAPHTATRTAAWSEFVRDTFSGFVTTTHHLLLALGILAIFMIALMLVKPQTVYQLKDISLFGMTTRGEVATGNDAGASIAQPPLLSTTARPLLEAPDAQVSGIKDIANVHAPHPDAKQQQWVTTWLAKRYRVATDATNMLVSAAYHTAREIKLDPLLILSVMAIESGFNPFAESPVGAQGLMQVMSRVHKDKFEELGGIKAALNPAANIRVGSLILKEYVTRGGSVEAGLKMYVGAGSLDTDFGYGAKVLAEYRRLKEVAMGKKVPIYTTSAKASPPKRRPQSPAPDTAASQAAGTTALPIEGQVAAL